MNRRERVLTALSHKEPDRVPIDLGSTCDSSISALTYQQLRTSLNLKPNITRVVDVLQQGAIIDVDVLESLNVDLMFLFNGPKTWRKNLLADGTPALFPSKFRDISSIDGSREVFDKKGNIIYRMPSGGFYFEPVYRGLARVQDVTELPKYKDLLLSYDAPFYTNMSFEILAEKAKSIHEQTDFALVGYFGGHILQAGQVLRGWEQFLIDLAINKKLAHGIMDTLLEGHLKRFEYFASTIGKYVDVIHFEEDLGMQDRPLMSLDLFHEMVKPYMKKLFSFVKMHSNAFILLHTDGAVEPFIPDFIDMGVDALNPVQVSAIDMDTYQLKKKYGKEIAFWGAGCESQNVLPNGTPKQIAEEVKRRIDDLAPEGGYIFSPIHNIQHDVPIKNVMTMYQTALEYGKY